MNGLAAQLGQEVADVLERVRPSLVQIGSGRRGGGAGTIWHESGLILSNAHVAGRSPLQVTLANGTKLPARVLARDAELDIAALSVSANGLPTIGLGESKRLRAGQLVLALGHPWGVVATATAGVVVGMGSQWPELPRSRREWVVVDLRLRPGNSGGQLVDVRSRLVGINTMITGPEVGLAVPVHVVKAFLREALDAQRAAS